MCYLLIANQFLVSLFGSTNPSIALNVGEQHGKEHYEED
jgi:hypothetical protein